MVTIILKKNAKCRGGEEKRNRFKQAMYRRLNSAFVRLPLRFAKDRHYVPLTASELRI